MPRLTQPELDSYEINWGTNTAQKLSGKTYTNPSGQEIDCSQVSVTCSAAMALKRFIITSVKDGRDFGFHNDVLVDCDGSSPTGVKVAQFSDIPAASTRTFTLKAPAHFNAGDGLYRIGLYVQNSEGTWNYEYLFFEVNNLQFMTSDGKDFQVPVHTTIS